MSVLFDPLMLSNINDHPDGDRFEYLGCSDQDRLLYVVTVEKSENEIRIISARKADSKERRGYEKKEI